MSLSPQPVPIDSTNSRLHRTQLASAVNALLKRVFENNADLTTTIVALSTTVSANTAAITSEASVRATADTAIAATVTTLTATVGTNTAAISAEAVTRATADSALSATITSLTATVSSNTAAISSEASARASADSAIASSVTTLTSTVSGNTASISTLTSSVNGLYAMWGVELDVNGHVIGRVKLDGTGGTSEFAVAASKFTVYDGVSSTTPAFQISGGVAVLNVPLQTNAVAATHIQTNAAGLTDQNVGSTTLTTTPNTFGNVAVTAGSTRCLSGGFTVALTNASGSSITVTLALAGNAAGFSNFLNVGKTFTYTVPAHSTVNDVVAFFDVPGSAGSNMNYLLTGVTSSGSISCAYAFGIDQGNK